MDDKIKQIQIAFADNNITPLDVVRKSQEIEKNDYPITYPTVLKITKGKKVSLSTMTRFIRAFNAIVKANGGEKVSSSIFMVE